MSDETYEGLSYVMSSKYRLLAVEALGEKPQTPSEVARHIDCDVTHASRALLELRDRGIVELLVPDDVEKGRIYGLTEAGETVEEIAVETGRIKRPATDGGDA